MEENKKHLTYLISDGRYYKVGKSKNPMSRLKQIQTGNISVKLVCCGDGVSESFLHGHLKDYSVGLEWFDLPEDKVNEVINLISNGYVLNKIPNINTKRRFGGDYVIVFGKHKGRTLKSMTSPDDIQYCIYVWKSLFAREDSPWYKYKHRRKCFEWYIHSYLPTLNKA